MKLEFTPNPQDQDPAPTDGDAVAGNGDSRPSNKRTDPRHSFAAQALVAIPGLPSRAYEVREISRGGMFLAFRELRSTLLDFEQNDVETGASVEVAFTFSRPDGRHQFSVRGTISRITRQGIGVRFATHNPPQLAALRELFAGAMVESQGGPGTAARPLPGSAKPAQRRILERPADDTAWADWKLLD